MLRGVAECGLRDTASGAWGSGLGFGSEMILIELYTERWRRSVLHFNAIVIMRLVTFALRVCVARGMASVCV